MYLNKRGGTYFKRLLKSLKVVGVKQLGGTCVRESRLPTEL